MIAATNLVKKNSPLSAINRENADEFEDKFSRIEFEEAPPLKDLLAFLYVIRNEICSEDGCEAETPAEETLNLTVETLRKIIFRLVNRKKKH